MKVVTSKKQHKISFAFKFTKNRAHLQKLFLLYIHTYRVLHKSCCTYTVLNNSRVYIIQHRHSKSVSFFSVPFLVESVFSSFFLDRYCFFFIAVLFESVFSFFLFLEHFLGRKRVFLISLINSHLRNFFCNFGQDFLFKSYSLFSENLNKHSNTFYDMIYCITTFFCINKKIVLKLFCFLIESCV